MWSVLDSTLAVWLALIFGALGVLYVAALRATTIADLEIERGVVRVVRGGIAPPILADLRDIARAPPIERARIRIVRSSGRAEVMTHGVTSEQAQRIRNVIGSVPLARLVNALKK
jgi:hypothetical protein